MTLLKIEFINFSIFMSSKAEVERQIRKLSEIRAELEHIRRSLDSDIRNVKGIDSNFSRVGSCVDSDIKDLYRIASFLEYADKAYKKAEKRIKDLVDDLLKPKYFPPYWPLPSIPGGKLPGIWTGPYPIPKYPGMPPGIWTGPYPIPKYPGMPPGFWTGPYMVGEGFISGIWGPLAGSTLTVKKYFLDKNITLTEKLKLGVNEKTDSGYTGNLFEYDSELSSGYAKVGTNAKLFGYEYNKPSGFADWDFEKGRVGAGIEAGIEGYVAKGEVRSQIGLLSSTAQVTALTAGVQGEAKAVLFDKGKFDPKLKVGVNAEATALKGSVEKQFGTDDFNIHSGAEGKVGTAKAEATAFIGKEGVGAKAEAGAAVFKGEVKSGFSLFGINVDFSVEGEALSVGAKAEFGVKEGEIKLGGKLSFLAGLGLNLKISW